MIDHLLVRTIEELSMNAWPALHTLHDDGWVLLFANGYTRRANSVYPLYPPTKDIIEKIEAAEAFYRGLGQRVVFKLTDAALPSELDEVLARRGYQADTRVHVWVMDLAPGVDAPPPPGLLLSETPTPNWLEAYAHINGSDDQAMAAHEQILRAILPERRFATITVNGQIVACGLAVLQNDWVGFYNICTHSAHRKQGYAHGLMQALLAWAKTAGAARAYLQVMQDNSAALALYAKLGFREAYQYWYQAKE